MAKRAIMNSESPLLSELKKKLESEEELKGAKEEGTEGNHFYDIAINDVENGEINRLFVKELKEVGTTQIINGLNEVFSKWSEIK